MRMPFFNTLALSALLGFSPAARGEEALFLGKPPEKPVRIISLAPSLTEFLFALGQGHRVVGVSRYDDFPKEVSSLPKVGGFLDPSLEGILALHPDLVVCVPNSGNQGHMRTLARMGVPVVVIPAYDLDDVYSTARVLGRVLGCESRAKELISDIQKRLGEIERRVAGRKRVQVLLAYGREPLVAAGPDSFAGALLRIAGGENVLASQQTRYPNVPVEVLLDLRPEVILDASGAGHTGQGVSSHWSRWQVLPAVRSGRVYQVDSSLWFRPGPRLPMAVEEMAQLLYPDLKLDSRPRL